MLELSTRIEFKGWKKFQSFDQEKIELAYVAFMENVGDKAEDLWDKHVPRGWADKPQIYNMREHIHQGHIEKHPWGYSVDVGITPVEEAATEGADPMYPRYVDEGTGIYNLKKSHGRSFIKTGAKAGNFASNGGLIVPKTKQYMVFDAPAKDMRTGEFLEGEVRIFARATRGQKGQHFSDRVQKELNSYVRVRKRALKLLIERAITEGKIDKIR